MNVLTQYKSIALIGVLFTVILFYSPLYNAGFTNWDDQIHVTDNKRVKTAITWESVAEMFRPHTEYMYHPVTMLTYLFEWNSGDGDPRIFHLFSLLLHVCNVLLVYRIIGKVTHDYSAALLVALLFGIHPVNVETVSWISARKDLLYSFFFLAGVDLYVGYVDGKHRLLSYAGIVLVFVLGLLSKPTMVAFPLVLLLIDWWKRRPIGWYLIIEKIPIIVIAVGFGIFTMVLSGADEKAITIMGHFQFRHQVLMVCYAAVFYAGKLIIPIELSALYHYPTISSGALPWMYYAAPIILALLAAGLILAGRRWRFLLFGAGLYIIPLLLVLQILPFNNTSLVAERYAYVSSAGIMLIMILGVKHLLSAYAPDDPFWKGTVSVLITVVTLVFMVGTASRIAVWKDSVALFSSVIERDQTVWIAYANRAVDRIKLEQYHEALEDVNRAIILYPARKALYGIRGNVYFFLKEYRTALADFDTITFSDKAKPYDYYNKGASLYYLHNYDSALAYYSKALKADTAFARAYLGYGMILMNERRKPAEARAYFDAAIRYDADLWEAYYYRGAVFQELGNVGNALNDASTSLMLNPKIVNDTMITRINAEAISLSARINEVKMMVEKETNSASLFAELSRSYLRLGDTIRAQHAAERAEDIRKRGGR
jgi:tetratricopeptide (TPR) repeat protein